ncbi:MAG: hypothetical protein IJL03_07065 [Lachnospiraceae bacterium]|nr:hypothetical protein [Lachnospiraceae bacterium]
MFRLIRNIKDGCAAKKERRDIAAGLYLQQLICGSVGNGGRNGELAEIYKAAVTRSEAPEQFTLDNQSDSL